MSPHPGIPSPQVTGGRSALFPTQSMCTPKRPEGEFTRRRRCSRTKEDRRRRTKRRNTQASSRRSETGKKSSEEAQSFPLKNQGRGRRMRQSQDQDRDPRESRQVARPCQRRELTEGAPLGARPCTSQQRHPRGPASGGRGERQ